MKLERIISAIIVVLITGTAYTQNTGATIKITDNDDVATIITRASSSSSSSCNSPDFPVIRGGSYKNINFSELSRIIVYPYLPTDDPNYIKIELVPKEGEPEKLDIIKYIRFTGYADQEKFGIRVMDIKMVEVMED